LGNNAKDMRDKTKEETHVVCKEVGVRKREQVTPEGCGENISGGITKRIRLEMKQKQAEIRNDGRDVLYIRVPEVGMYY
jgi:hypothetical protein